MLFGVFVRHLFVDLHRRAAADLFQSSARPEDAPAATGKARRRQAGESRQGLKTYRHDGERRRLPDAAARFPGRAPIDAYGNGGFRFADMSHRGSILALPSGIEAWAVARRDRPYAKVFLRLIQEAADIEVLLIGTGDQMLPLPKAARAALESAGLFPDLMSTGAAVRTFNVLLSEERAVAAALVAVESAR